MFRKKTLQHSLSRQNFLRLLGTVLLTATSLFLLAGCGGGGSNTGTVGSPFAGSYQGTYLSTSGLFSPDAGTITLTATSSGMVTGASHDFTGAGGTNSFTGTVTSSGSSGSGGALVTNAVSGPVSVNSTTHVFTTTYTEANGTKGTLSMGLAPTASPLAGSYSGTFTSTASGSGTTALTVTSTGAVTGTTIQAGVTSQISGYVDTNGNAYLAYTSGGVPVNTIGVITVNGTSLTGTLQQSGADGSSNSIMAVLTKQ